MIVPIKSEHNTELATLENFLLWNKNPSLDDLPSAMRCILPYSENPTKKLKVQTTVAPSANTFADIEFIKQFEEKILIPRFENFCTSLLTGIEHQICSCSSRASWKLSLV